MRVRWLVLMVFVLLGQAAAQDTDVVYMKDGTKRTGIIVEETPTQVVLQIVVKNSKGAIAAAGKLTLARAEIEDIEPMDSREREKLKARAEAFADRGLDRHLRLGRIAVERVTVDGRAGVRAAGEMFEVRTTCDEDFARDACDALQQAYKGYLRHFKLRRRTRGTIPVTILADKAEYDAYVTRLLGRPVVNPAFYHTKQNAIVAYNLIQADEAARIKEGMRAQQEQVDALRKQATEYERKVDQTVREARDHVKAEVKKAKAQIRKVDDARHRSVLYDRLKDWEKDALADIKRREKEIDGKLKDFRRKMTEAIAECNRAISHNERVLRNQNRSMFEMLFHECFHAFARNRLFGDTEIPRWLNEGMASYFEMSAVEGDLLIHGAPNQGLLTVYRDGDKAGALPALEEVLRGRGEMFVVLHQGTIDRANRSYAVSWALVHYLSSRMSAEQMDRYLTAVAGGADAAEALAKALGKSLAEIEAGVRAHVATVR